MGGFSPFHATGLLLYPLKTSKIRLSVFSEGIEKNSDIKLINQQTTIIVALKPLFSESLL